MSLGLPTDSRAFWAKCARRLRLDVYDDESGDVDWDEEAEPEPMSYDDVEKALGLEREEGTEPVPEDESEAEDDEIGDDIDMASVSGSDHGSVELGAGTAYVSGPENAALPELDATEKQAVKREMNELLIHSALEYPRGDNPRATLRNRIRAERAHEAYADQLDAKASFYEEKRLWVMLDRQPPMELVRPDVPDEPPKIINKGVDKLIRGFSRTPGDWRSKLEIIPSRWEMEYALVKDKEEEKAKGEAGAESGDDI